MRFCLAAVPKIVTHIPLHYVLMHPPVTNEYISVQISLLTRMES